MDVIRIYKQINFLGISKAITD